MVRSWLGSLLFNRFSTLARWLWQRFVAWQRTTVRSCDFSYPASTVRGGSDRRRAVRKAPQGEVRMGRSRLGSLLFPGVFHRPLRTFWCALDLSPQRVKVVAKNLSRTYQKFTLRVQARRPAYGTRFK